MRDIARWHKERGFLKVGYHFGIARDGNIEQGRHWTEPGAHVMGYNKHSIGIVLYGGLDEAGKPEDNFTEAQWESLVDLLKEVLFLFPGVPIVGHRDIPNVKKDCPCFDVKTKLKEIGVYA